MITPEMAASIKKKLYSVGCHKGLENDFNNFLKEESLCKKDVKDVIGLYQRALIQEALFTFANNGELTIDEGQVRTLSERMRKALQFAFSIGLTYGKAKMSTIDFEQSIKESVKDQENEFLDLSLIDQLRRNKEINDVLNKLVNKNIIDDLKKQIEKQKNLENSDLPPLDEDEDIDDDEEP